MSNLNWFSTPWTFTVKSAFEVVAHTTVKTVEISFQISILHCILLSHLNYEFRLKLCSQNGILIKIIQMEPTYYCKFCNTIYTPTMTAEHCRNCRGLLTLLPGYFTKDWFQFYFHFHLNSMIYLLIKFNHFSSIVF